MKNVSNRAQVEICSRQFIYQFDQDFLEEQMLSNDWEGNNPLHFAFRSKKPDTIDLIIRAGFGELDHRNYQGKTPKESTHNAELTDPTKQLLVAFDPTSQRPREPHYVFIVNAKRIDVLKSQLEDSLGLTT